jgi:hypothetical protein
MSYCKLNVSEANRSSCAKTNDPLLNSLRCKINPSTNRCVLGTKTKNYKRERDAKTIKTIKTKKTKYYDAKSSHQDCNPNALLLKLKKTMEQSQLNTHQLTPEHEIVSFAENMYIFNKSDRISQGSYNVVFKVSNKKETLALRININPLTYRFDFDDAYNEALLTMRLSQLEITPKVYDFFFAYMCGTHKTHKSGVRLFVLSNLSNEGSLNRYFSDFDKKKISDHDVIDIANQSINLYTKMVENEILCTDVKLDNMVANTNPNGTVSIKLIDFDTHFCSASNSKITFTRILEQVSNIQNGQFIKDARIKIKPLFINYNLLQVALSNIITNNVGIYYKQLVDNIDEQSLLDMSLLLKCRVGDGTRTIGDTFRHYLKHYAKDIITKYPDISKNNLSMLCTSFIFAKYGATISIAKLAIYKKQGLNIDVSICGPDTV